MKLVHLGQLPDEPVSHDRSIPKRVMLRVGDVPHVTNFSQARLVDGQAATGHSHTDMWEVFLVEAGEGVMVVDEVSHALEAGACVVVEPGERHELRATGAGTLVVTYFGVVP